VGVEKMSVSFDLELGNAIRTAANRHSQSVSAWIAEAVRDRLRNEALTDAVTAWEQSFGDLTEAEVAEANRLLDQAAEQRHSGAA
jgi:predicted transcriptional regulator